MIRFAWRQMRLPAISTATLLAALVVLLVLTEHSISSYLSSSGLRGCLSSGGDCTDQLNSFLDKYGPWTNLITLLGFAPALAGLFWGAPLIAREVEQGTHRLAWSQSVSRRHWFAVRVGLYVLGAAAVGALLTWLFTWWYGPFREAAYGSYDAIQPPVFESSGVILAATMVFSFAVGIAAGAVIRRTVPAMAVALAGYLGERIVFQLWRGYLLPPRTVSFPAFSGFPRANMGDWVMDQKLVDASGHHMLLRDVVSICPFVPGKGGITSVAPCAAQHGIQSVIRYQPLSRFWPLQGIESGILVGVAVLLLAVAAWWTLRRIA